MSGQINDGGPAFPFEEHFSDGSVRHTYFGMSLRTYIAIEAMKCFITPAVYSIVANDTEDGDALISKRAHQVADAMLRAQEEA